MSITRSITIGNSANTAFQHMKCILGSPVLKRFIIIFYYSYLYHLTIILLYQKPYQFSLFLSQTKKNISIFWICFTKYCLTFYIIFPLVLPYGSASNLDAGFPFPFRSPKLSVASLFTQVLRKTLWKIRGRAVKRQGPGPCQAQTWRIEQQRRHPLMWSLANYRTF